MRVDMRRRWWGATAVVAAAVSGALVVQGVTGGPTDGSADDGKSRPVESKARTAQLEVADDGVSAQLGKRDTEPFSMLGVTWADASARVAGVVEVRTRDARTGEWSSWLKLDGNSGKGEAGAARGGTEPAWVGQSDGVEVRVDGKASAGLPKGLRLDMIDPGNATASGLEPAAHATAETDTPTAEESTATASPEVSTSETATTEPSAPQSASGSSTPSTSPSGSGSASPSPSTSVPAAPPSIAPKPAITSRAGWGADESISPEKPGYLPGGKVKAVVVHHTAESNNYTCEQAPAVVRGIYAYHVKQLGWKDIGYNFLVDKCGTLYEGRKGGVDKPVMGAHAYGFNAETTGVSVLGTYADAAPSKEAMTSVARIAAWKLGQYGVDPTGTTTLTAGADGTNYFRKSWAKGAKLTFPAIHGHRDGYNTQCPGDAFYNQLPTIRSWAGGQVSDSR